MIVALSDLITGTIKQRWHYHDFSELSSLAWAHAMDSPTQVEVTVIIKL
jgi:hypothetical protein